MILITDVAPAASEDIRIQLGLGVAVPVNAVREDALRAWPVVGTAADNAILRISGTMRTS